MIGNCEHPWATQGDRGPHCAACGEAWAVVEAREGMEWWNGLSKEDRQHWMRQAGNTGVAADAWSAFKIQMRT